MSWDEISESVCPIARSLVLVGDRWTMLILRELTMDVHRFDELQAQTGMSSHLLSTRLKRMEEDGIIARHLYNERPPRYEYHTTQKGKELDPLLMMLRTWGRKWEGDYPPGEPAVTLVHKTSGIVLDDLWQIPNGGKDFTFDDIEPIVGAAFAAERANRSAAFQAGKQPALKTAIAKVVTTVKPDSKPRTASGKKSATSARTRR